MLTPETTPEPDFLDSMNCRCHLEILSLQDDIAEIGDELKDANRKLELEYANSAELSNVIHALLAKVADLEKQLEAAKSANTSTRTALAAVA